MSNVRVINPISNTDVFGIVPALTLNSQKDGIINTAQAPIYLVAGRHMGPNFGYGVAHIWAEHKKEILQAGFTSQNDVPAYVQRILTAPGLIYYEDRKIKRLRVNTVRIVTGTVILEYVRTVIDRVETPHWTVVTAYSNTRTAGVVVGQI